MQYQTKDGTWKPLVRGEVTNHETVPYEPTEVEQSEPPNIRCDCGNGQFFVAWWNYDFCGGFCRVVCAACGESAVLINDFA